MTASFFPNISVLFQGHFTDKKGFFSIPDQVIHTYQQNTGFTKHRIQRHRGCLPVPRSPILWVPHAAAPPRWGSAGAWGAAAIPPHSAFPAAGGIRGQGEIHPRGCDSTGCTEELFIAQDGWLQVVWLGGTVAVILFIVRFQNLSKQKKQQKNPN